MFKRILVPLDGSSLAECVLPHVIALATLHDAPVTLLRVMEAREGRERSSFANPLDAHLDGVIADAYLAETADRLSRVGILAETVTLSGPAAEQIVAFARQGDIDLIVMSSHGKSGLSAWNVSSVTQKVILRAHRSVMVVRAYVPPREGEELVPYRRVLVPLDGSQRAECILPAAIALAQAHDAQLILAHIVRKTEMPHHLRSYQEDMRLVETLTGRQRRAAEVYLEDLRARLSVGAKVELLIRSDVTGALRELAERSACDLVMLSAHGHSGSPRFTYGSVATGLIAYGSTPLLIVQDLVEEQIEPLKAELAIREQQGH
jgi:nucleotide-binding universal stress UspA family protein